jgi:hypothetical protein
MILFITVISSPILSQSISSEDSVYAKKLRQFIDEYYFLDSAYSSALIEIQADDSIIHRQETIIANDNRQIFVLEDMLAGLRLRNAEMEKNQLKWWHWAGGAGLVAYAVYITYKFLTK